MTDETLHIFSETNGLPFENVLVGYVKEQILKHLYERGYARYLWLKNKSMFSLRGYAGRVDRSLKFVYKEDERILKNDGFVPGTAFDADFLVHFFEHELQTIPGLTVKEPEYTATTISFDVYYKEMYVPILLEIKGLKEENITAQAEILKLPILNVGCEALMYPMEQEAAAHVACICKELELINEMEHYLEAFKIFSENSLEGVRLQNAIRQELKRVNLDYSRDDLKIVLGFREYSYMKKKWKVLLRRQKQDNPSWEEVIDLLDRVLSPIWDAGKQDMIFFGDWMPEIGRYLD